MLFWCFSHSGGVTDSRERYCISETSMRVLIPKRKKCQYRDGHHVTIARTNNVTCPYPATKRLISAGKLGSDFHLIGQIVHTKNGQFCKPTSTSYFRARDILRDGLSNYLQPGFNFGTHSLRTGAVSHAANSSQVPSSASDKHVGWKFKRSKFRYIKDNEHASSLVSRNLRSLINSM